MKKKILALVLSCTLAFALAAPAGAAGTQAQQSAYLLYHLGLFFGEGVQEDGSPQFSLDRAPTRAEAVTMLVRLLSAEKEALAQDWDIPFTDVPHWAEPYVGYAYAHGLANGVDFTRFGSDQPTTAAHYLTFVLRALGYLDGADFTWSEPWVLSDQLGITDGSYGTGRDFLRADVALTAAKALDAPRKGQSLTLLQQLRGDNSVTTGNLVIWDHSLVSIQENFISFLFHPAKGTTNGFASFKVDQVSVNGQPCETLQVTTPEAVAAYLASISSDAGGFGYIEISYDEDAALKAATETYTDPAGHVYPLLTFTFRYTATQADGKVLTGSFSTSYYLDADGE